MSKLIFHCDRCKKESEFGQSAKCVYRAVHMEEGLGYWIEETDKDVLDEIKFYETIGYND